MDKMTRIDNEIVIEDKLIKFQKDPVLIVGVAGIGLLGVIIANTLISQIKDMKRIGYIVTKTLPPIAVFYDGVLRHPVRLYYSKEHNILVFISEIPLQRTSEYRNLIEVVFKWIKQEKLNIKEMVVFQGLFHSHLIDEHKAYYVSEEDNNHFEKYDIKKLGQGIVIGPEAHFLNMALNYKIKAFGLFTEVSTYPTLEGAAVLTEKLNQIYQLNIDTSLLLKEGKDIKKKMMGLAEKTPDYHKKELENVSSSSTYDYYR